MAYGAGAQLNIASPMFTLVPVLPITTPGLQARRNRPGAESSWGRSMAARLNFAAPTGTGPPTTTHRGRLASGAGNLPGSRSRSARVTITFQTVGTGADLISMAAARTAYFNTATATATREGVSVSSSLPE